MIRRPPRSTRTDTLFPYTTIFRSAVGDLAEQCAVLHVVAVQLTPAGTVGVPDGFRTVADNADVRHVVHQGVRPISARRGFIVDHGACNAGLQVNTKQDRPDERRVGKECVSKSRYRW